jgi:hypothetical protein
MKATVIILLIAIAVILGVFFLRQSPVAITPTPTPSTTSDAQNLCYYYSQKTPRGFYDRAWIRMNITSDDKVTGEFYNYPAETDSKWGSFEGTIAPANPEIRGRRAELMWDTHAEGMEATEELWIQYNEDNATPLYGVMVDRGDGVYVYKDKSALTPGFVQNKIDCADLDELQAVEKYMRDNIASVATNKAVVGGTWQVVTVNIQPQDNKGTVVYEDGHIQSQADFTYTYDPKTKVTTVVAFDVKK